MSFKREGNDDKWLSILTKRRVSELLAEDIPEEEARIIKNGRLCCFVCHHRPTFDTLEMLSIHRRGKKHENYAVIFREKQKEIEELKARRGQVPNYKTTDVTRPALGAAGSSSGSLLKTEPYNPRVKKRRLDPDQRKHALQIDPPDYGGDIGNSRSEPSTTQLSSLPGNARPYARVPKVTNEAEPAKWPVGNKDFHSGKANITSIGPVKRGPQQNLPQTISEYIKNKTYENQTFHIKPYMKKGEMMVSDGSDESHSSKGNILRAESQTVDILRNEKKAEKRKAQTSNPVQLTTVTEEKVHKVQKYLQATSSGWKLDWTGQKWIRDENVEFDSDEEPPELPT